MSTQRDRSPGREETPRSRSRERREPAPKQKSKMGMHPDRLRMLAQRRNASSSRSRDDRSGDARTNSYQPGGRRRENAGRWGAAPKGRWGGAPAPQPSVESTPRGGRWGAPPAQNATSSSRWGAAPAQAPQHTPPHDVASLVNRVLGAQNRTWTSVPGPEQQMISGDCRLQLQVHVGNIPPSFTVPMLQKFLTSMVQAVPRATGYSQNPVSDVSPISEGQTVVRFSTPEDADIALCLDGMEAKQNEDSKSSEVYRLVIRRPPGFKVLPGIAHVASPLPRLTRTFVPTQQKHIQITVKPGMNDTEVHYLLRTYGKLDALTVAGKDKTVPDGQVWFTLASNAPERAWTDAVTGLKANDAVLVEMNGVFPIFPHCPPPPSFASGAFANAPVDAQYQQSIVQAPAKLDMSRIASLMPTVGGRKLLLAPGVGQQAAKPKRRSRWHVQVTLPHADHALIPGSAPAPTPSLTVGVFNLFPTTFFSDEGERTIKFSTLSGEERDEIIKDLQEEATRIVGNAPQSVEMQSDGACHIQMGELKHAVELADQLSGRQYRMRTLLTDYIN